MINPHIYAKMPFDPLKDFVPVASLSSNQLVLAVNPSVPANDLREFVEFARRTKPPLFYASIGNGSQHHLAMEMLKRHVGIDLIHVPYRGGGPAAIALVAGEVSAMFGGGSLVPTVHAGQVRGLASTGNVRNPATPDLPTIDEVYPGYEALIWQLDASSPLWFLRAGGILLRSVASAPRPCWRGRSAGSSSPPRSFVGAGGSGRCASARARSPPARRRRLHGAVGARCSQRPGRPGVADRCWAWCAEAVDAEWSLASASTCASARRSRSSAWTSSPVSGSTLERRAGGGRR